MEQPGSTRPKSAVSARQRWLLRAASSLRATFFAVLGAWLAFVGTGTALLATVWLRAGVPRQAISNAIIVLWAGSLFLLPLGAFLTPLAGLPTRLILTTFRLRQAPVYGLAGATAGAFTSHILGVSLPIWDPAGPDATVGVALGAVAGLAGSLSFWAASRSDF